MIPSISAMMPIGMHAKPHVNIPPIIHKAHDEPWCGEAEVECEHRLAAGLRLPQPHAAQACGVVL